MEIETCNFLFFIKVFFQIDSKSVSFNFYFAVETLNAISIGALIVWLHQLMIRQVFEICQVSFLRWFIFVMRIHSWTQVGVKYHMLWSIFVLQLPELRRHPSKNAIFFYMNSMYWNDSYAHDFLNWVLRYKNSWVLILYYQEEENDSWFKSIWTFKLKASIVITFVYIKIFSK